MMRELARLLRRAASRLDPPGPGRPVVSHVPSAAKFAAEFKRRMTEPR